MQKNLKKWILLADDDKELLELYESFLDMHFGESVKVLTVEDGVEATNKLPFQAFDLIITDLNMPKKSGHAFIQAVKESQMNEHTPILVITGEDPDGINEQKITILLKPLNQTKFIEVVANQLKLGKTDQRVAADLLNTFIDSGHYLLDKGAGLEVTQEPPSPKKEGENVDGDHMVLIAIKVGKIKNSFLFSFDNEVIKRLGQKQKVSSEEEFSKVVKATGDAIARYSIKKYKEQSINILNEINVERDSQEFKRLKKAKGLKIPIRTPLGYVNIYGLMNY
ncbi:MAG: response regulator [Bdellovibrionales bacterium]|nr:response regulator [Bdellovibrionales bacterium]